MKEGWSIKLLKDALLPTETIDPTKFPEHVFEYIDVSSVSNETLSIETTQQIKGADAPSRARRSVKANDVLFATIRPTLRRIAVVPPDLDDQVCSTGYFVLRAGPNLEPRFVFYFLQTERFLNAMEKLQKGASYPAVNDGDVRSQSIAFPSLPEQRRIVAVLDEAFAGLATAQANAEKNLKNARALFESQLQGVVTRNTPNRKRLALGDLCTFVGGSQPPKSVFSKAQTEGSVRLIQIRDYKSDKNTVFIPHARAKRFCSKDDVMIGRYGPPIFQILRGLEGAYNVALMKAIPNELLITKDYLFYFLKHSDILNYVIYHANRAAGQIGITKETLEQYPIWLPPIDAQSAIVDLLNTLEAESERLARVQTNKIAAIAELRKSLLHRAFNGEL